MFEAVRDEFGTVDILINNAGLQQDAPVDQMTLAQWNKVIGVNLTGQFLCARAAVHEFLRRGRRPEVSRALGKIICMSSVHQIIPWAGHVNYASSKGGINMMMQSMAQELAPLKNLASLSLGSRITDASLRELTAFPKLTSLILSHTQVTDAGLKELAHHKDLQSLNLKETGVTDAGLANLRGCKNLPEVYLMETPVTAAG
jgi:NAD(P)-dependent dehydrogenase (short-subunit alcohol dehydrogenase family)